MGTLTDWIFSNLNWIITVIVILAVAIPILTMGRRQLKGHVKKSDCTV